MSLKCYYKTKKHIATLAPIELKQSQHNLITAVTHPVPNLPVLSRTRWSRLTSRSNFQREKHLLASISNLRSRPCACWCVRLGCKRLANHRSKWMFTLFFYDHVHILIFFTRNGMNDGLAPVISSYLSCLYLFSLSCWVREDALVLPLCRFCFIAVDVFSPWEAAGMNRCRGWKCAGRQSYRRVQFTVSYIAAIVFLSASISSYVTCGKDVKFCCFVWVVGHKRFSCLMLLLLKGERWASVVPVRPPQITAMFLCLMFCFFFIYLLNLLYPKPKHRCWVNRPTFSPILLSVLKICPRLAFVLHTFGSSASKTICKNKLWTQKKDLKGFQIVTVYSLFVFCFKNLYLNMTMVWTTKSILFSFVTSVLRRVPVVEWWTTWLYHNVLYFVGVLSFFTTFCSSFFFT